MPPKGGTRKAFVHVGTHKTGTTALQMLLARNATALASAGIYLPRAGRPVTMFRTDIAGHHNLPWELLGDGRYHPADGTLAELSAEIAATEAPSVVITSEDFALTFDRPEALAALRDALVHAGYEPNVVVFLRPQGGYAQSLYAELAKQGAPVGFEHFLHDVMRDGAFSISGYTMPLDYTRLLDPFAACFGEDRIIVRAYRPGADPGALPRAFLSIVSGGAPIDPDGLEPAGTQNAAFTYRELLGALHATFAGANAAIPSLEALVAERFANGNSSVLDTAFAPLGTRDAQSISARFEASNRTVAERFGIAWASDSAPKDHPEQRAFFQHAVERWSA